MIRLKRNAGSCPCLVPVDNLNCRVPRQKVQEGEARKGSLRAQGLAGRGLSNSA